MLHVIEIKAQGNQLTTKFGTVLKIIHKSIAPSPYVEQGEIIEILDTCKL
jgi:hypothetical protein